MLSCHVGEVFLGETVIWLQLDFINIKVQFVSIQMSSVPQLSTACKMVQKMNLDTNKTSERR